MQLKEYINNLNDFAQQYPESLDMECITSEDDEGNGYNYIWATPTLGIFDDNDFLSLETVLEDGYYDQFWKDGVCDIEKTMKACNVVCVN